MQGCISIKVQTHTHRTPGSPLHHTLHCCVCVRVCVCTSYVSYLCICVSVCVCVCVCVYLLCAISVCVCTFDQVISGLGTPLALQGKEIGVPSIVLKTCWPCSRVVMTVVSTLTLHTSTPT